MTTAVDDIVYGLKNNRVEGARWKLGGALHTLQDFYSHSNWIERQNTQPHPQVGRGIRIESTASLHENTCIDCIKQAPSCPDCSRDLTTERLTTGYYGGQTDNSRPEGVAKCSHGGTKDSTATGGDEDNPTSGLNKDTKFCELSPHASLHATAASVGTAATKQFLLDLKGKVSETEFMQLLGIGPSVATVLDTSGSMESVWKDLADHMEKLRQGWGRLRGQEARHSLQRDLRGPLPFPAWARSHARRCSDQAALVGRETPRREVALVGRSTAQDTFCKEAHEVGDVRRAASRYDAGRLCAHGDATPALRAPT